MTGRHPVGSSRDHNGPMRLRIASATDVGRIAEVHVRTWQVAYRGQVPDEYLDSLSIEDRHTAWLQICLSESGRGWHDETG